MHVCVRMYVCYDTQNNDAKVNDNQHDNTEYNKTHHNVTDDNDTRKNAHQNALRFASKCQQKYLRKFVMKH
jgi:hypothetical protein